MMRQTIARLHRMLLERGLTISAAESCTGGWISKLLTDLPGSSGHFLGGVVAYSDGVKKRVLGVRPETLARFGAVSEETCREMCLGVQALTGSDVAVSVTGVAGPGGGSPEKPAGTVYAGFLVAEEVIVRRFSFRGGRESVRRRTCRDVFEALVGIVGEKRS
jgi:PncC family amidohydrolase